ncbi:exopolysaccharide transport family protein [Maritalea porphyrae]|uniref:exopolysaccharide transport family protein n=1 Tax=Maritalea porphyrae TaxID=880732 RepID=UPI0022B00BE1|nr:Wzz/FepE/Etk N-terminal domain-containing protein [Maritalea porphyrae]MCZ4270813.1 Wzz/FepE/Etk N-terminal domain-containing protein [Maritalea porphyrae]
MTQNGPRSYEDVQINMFNLFGAIFRALPRILVVTAILCGLTFVSFSFMTKQYSAETSVLLEPRSDSFAQSAGTRTNQTSVSAVDGAAIASQIQLLKSRETLLRVVDELDLRSNAEFVGSSVGPLDLVFALFSVGQDAATKAENDSTDDKIIGKLTKNLVAAQARDSRVISIKYTSESAQTASKVANALAKALVDRRSGLSISDTSDATVWLSQEIKRLSADVSAAENAVANFRVNNDLFRSTETTSLIGQQLSDLSRQISTVSERKNAASTRARLIRDLLSSGRSLEAVPDVRQSPIVQRMSEQKANFQASRAQSSATLLDNHPTLQALDAQIRDIDRQIQLEGRRIAESLETQARIEGELEKSLRDDLVRLKLSASGAERSGVTLAELEREAAAKRDLLNTFLARQSEATARTNTGAIFPDVRIISTAATPTKASAPNKPFLLLLVGGLSVVIQLGMVIISELAAGNVITVRHELQREEVADLAVRTEPMVNTQPEQKEDEFARFKEPVAETLPEVAPEPASLRELREAASVFEEPEVQETVYVEPSPQRVEQAAVSHPPSDLTKIAKSIRQNGMSTVLVASADQTRADSVTATQLQQHLSLNGASTILVNAGGADNVGMLGLTDMCVGEADFGGIIKVGASENEFFVPWGTKSRLQFSNERFSLMFDALGEIYDYVIVECGQFGLRAPLSPFADMDATLLIVGDFMDTQMRAHMEEDANAIGIDNVSFVTRDKQESNVA